MMKLYKKLCLLITAALFTLAARGQQTIFAPANVSSITSSVPFSDGSTAGLINGNNYDYNGPSTPLAGPFSVTFKLVQPAIISIYDIYFFGLASWGCDSIKISGSNDNSNYTLLNKQATLPFLNANSNDVSANFPNSTAYTYYRFTFSGTTNSNNDGDVDIAEIIPYSAVLSIPPVLTIPPRVGNKVSLSWNSVIHGTGSYEVDRSVNGTDFTVVQTVNTPLTAYTDTIPDTTVTYWYKIRAANTASNSPYSNIVEVTDHLLTAPALTVTATSPSGTEARLSWSFTPNTSVPYHFELDQSTDGTNFTQFGKFAGKVNAYNEESLTPNTTYWFRIRAYNYISQSPYSAIVKVTTTSNANIPTDITDDGGKLYVSNSSNASDPSEGASNFIDNNLTTKWLVFASDDPDGQLAAIYKPTGSYIVSSYAIATAKDADSYPARNPKNWTFAASNDSTTWVTLDTRTNQFGSGTPPSTLYNFTIANPGTVPYKYYRVFFTADNGGDNVAYQMDEWQIFGTVVGLANTPTALNVSGTTASAVSLAWSEATPPSVNSYTLQRSLDAINYATIASNLPASPLTYTDNNLLNDTTYYYRVQASAGATSGWSNVASGKTAGTPGIPSVPSNLLITAVSDSSISLQWHDRSINETGFNVERSTDGVTFAPLTTVAANDTTFTDHSVWSATKYYYYVAATNATGSSSRSNVLDTTTTGGNYPPAAANPLIPRSICGGTGSYAFTFGTIVPGPNNEASQTLHVTSITTDSTSFFSAFHLTPEVNNGTVTYGFTTSGKAMPGDSCNILVTVKDNGGTANFGADSAVFAIKIYFVPLTVSIAADQPTTNTPRYQLINLTANSNAPENTTYTWNGNDGIEGPANLLTLRVRPIKTTTYTVTGTTPAGCQATAQVTISPISTTVVANVLTPNGDGVNDTWIIWGLDKMPNNNVQVFDMAGRLVFTKKKYDNDWGGTYNGALLPQGAYYYVVDPGNGDKTLKGMLNIIR
jgi:gliding motility-associated-like protein